MSDMTITELSDLIVKDLNLRINRASETYKSGDLKLPAYWGSLDNLLFENYNKYIHCVGNKGETLDGCSYMLKQIWVEESNHLDYKKRALFSKYGLIPFAGSLATIATNISNNDNLLVPTAVVSGFMYGAFIFNDYLKIKHYEQDNFFNKKKQALSDGDGFIAQGIVNAKNRIDDALKSHYNSKLMQKSILNK